MLGNITSHLETRQTRQVKRQRDRGANGPGPSAPTSQNRVSHKEPGIGVTITKVTGNGTIVLGKKVAATGIDPLPCGR